MPVFNMDANDHNRLKDYAAEHGVSMAAVVRTALESFFTNPIPIQHTVDGRTERGKTWYVNLFMWSEDQALEAAKGPYTIQSTGNLPQLAARELQAPELEALTAADLPRLRQVLARVQSTSARIPLEGGRIAQIDVHREAPI